MATNRINRISDQVMRELSGLIRELKDSRIPLMTSILKVNVTNDLRYAKVYVSVMGDAQTKQKALDGLTHAAGFLRRQLGGRVQLRYTPELIFVLDDSIAHGAHINALLHKVIHDDNDES